jgi:glycosyltransferase involved in cell wall biosynthesis
MKAPKISVVTITLNRREFLEKAIQSVLNQGYDNFEHIVVDGGSTDGTVEMLRNYPHLRWLSEPDDGQANAMNKGIAMTSGDIFAWLNSDDTYPAGTFEKVAAYAASLPRDTAMIYGTCRLVDRHGGQIGRTRFSAFDFRRLRMGFNNINTPAVFLRAYVFAEIGNFDETLRATYDVDMWTRVAQRFDVQAVPDVFSNLCLHDGSGLVSTRLHLREMPQLREKYWIRRSLYERAVLFNYYRLREYLYYSVKFNALMKKI